MIGYLGDLGRKLPTLYEKEWQSIFEFVEFFMLAEDIKIDHWQDTHFVNFNWAKVKEILELLGKMRNENVE